MEKENYRVIKSIEQLESVKRIQTKPLKVNFEGSDRNLIVRKIITDKNAESVYSVSENDKVLTENKSLQRVINAIIDAHNNPVVKESLVEVPEIVSDETIEEAIEDVFEKPILEEVKEEPQLVATEPLGEAQIVTEVKSKKELRQEKRAKRKKRWNKIFTIIINGVVLLVILGVILSQVLK